ncbi:acyltransferase family protein [Luteipulveratus flavus]|uniref:Acyltransferase n=1 Tax=Luteipulveratus flavus TaxID=3031728 RepID=A0ABT6C5T0_9MICO|nr:acyltransferase [Luteipulveratus sp. YIM 133296]MDF8264081.1 acyltransferase [Luteipulveratus sp. YIM 133296]
MKRIRLIDGLRAVAALLVLLSHVAFWTGASGQDVVGRLLARGDSGVAIFFALSAFLLLRPWFRHGLLDTPRPRPRTYAVRRLARILPAYWLALVAVLVVAALASSTGGTGSWPKVFAHVLVLQGLTGQTYQSFTQTWSLTTELTFYLAVPFLGAAASRALRSAGGVRTILARCGGLAVVGLALQGVAMAWTGAGSQRGAGVLATSIVGHGAWFAVGAAIAVTATARDAGRLPWRPDGRVMAWLRLLRSAGTCLLAALAVYVLAASPLAGPVDLTAPTVAEGVAKELLYALLAGLLLAAALVPTPAGSVAEAVGRHPATHWAGDISYGVFLWHVLVLQVIYLATGRPLFSGAFWWVLLPVLGLTTAVASLSAQLVEQPVLRRAHRRPAPVPAARE